MAALSRQQPIRIESPQVMDKKASAFSGEHRYVIDYLAVEVLRRQSEDVRTFLRKTGVLDRLCAPLCDAVADRADSNVMLARLEQANMFLLPLDDRRQWYRYHQLFADFLRSELDPAERRLLQQKASAWYEGNGLGNEAIKLALAAEDTPCDDPALPRARRGRAVTRRDADVAVVARRAPGQHRARAQRSRRLQIVAPLPARIDLRSPGLPASARPRARRASDAPPAARGMLYAFRAYLALNWGDPKDAIQPARKALEELGDSGSFFRVFAMNLLGQAHGLCGDRVAAIETLNKVVALGKKLGNHLMTLDALGHLTPLMIARGELREAILRCTDAASKYVDGAGEPLPLAGFVYVSLGILHYESNDLDAARRYLTTGIGLCQQLGMVYPTMIGQRALAKLQFVTGQREAAWNTLAEARDIAERPESPRRKRAIAVLTAELQLREGNVDAAARTLAGAHELLGRPPNMNR